MASSELSSSEINQGQGFYHDGRNELPGVPALPEPVSPGQVPIQAEEGMWKKYSSHYEFPLALVIAIGIHVIAILFVVAYMTINLYWGAPRQPDFVTYEEPRQDGNDQKDRQGGGSGAEGTNPDPLAPLFDPQIFTTPEQIKPLEANPFPDPFQKHVLPPAPDSKTKKSGGPGTGIGQGSGNGMGPGQGSSSYMGRSKRWRIHFSYDEPELLLSQFANLQITVACRLNNGRFLVYKNLGVSAPFKYEEMTETDFTTFVNGAKKLWFLTNERVTCDNFVYAVNLSDRPLTLVIIIPGEMEKAILAAELAYHKMTEDQIREKRLGTSFNVVREGSNWKVTVTKTGVLK